MQDCCKTGNDVWGRHMGSEESTEEVGRGRNGGVQMDEGHYKDGQNME